MITCTRCRADATGHAIVTDAGWRCPRCARRREIPFPALVVVGAAVLAVAVGVLSAIASYNL